jgi:arachidonate 15-lipoxygenase
MAPPGDFAMIFSYTPRGLWDLCESTSKSIRIQDYDPETSAHDRGLVGAVFDTPSLTNLCSLFTLFHDHATAYVDAYYASDEDLAQDAALGRWLEDLQTTIPNGVPLSFASLSRAGLSRLLALLMHVGVVEHEFRGTFLWNYQLWTHMQPVRVYRDGRREPVDVYQRLVNANLILNVNRTTLDTDFSYLALDGRGAELFRAFRQKLHELQAALNDEPRQVWKLYPDMLNANMNA